jgi:nonsense-mediated mRNA decay protein 3
MAQDEELFYQELEEDEETRAQVQIFKDENAINANLAAAAGDDEDDAPEVPIEDLLDELTLLQRQVDDEDEDDLDDSMQE